MTAKVSGAFASMINGAYVSALKKAMLMTLKLSITTKGDTNMIKNGLPVIHPGEFLAEILGEMGISQAEFARTIGVSPMRISHVIKGDRPVTAELALLFGRAFNQTPQYWLNLQASYDLKIAKASIGKRLAGIHALAHA
ncbi:MAG TPA: HigA family addiction module antitoxin [Dissulfurispiraceae bacterium]|nr:HigA family addiction module antitoxin [Dissulfurispiraceae bacterium]